MIKKVVHPIHDLNLDLITMYVCEYMCRSWLFQKFDIGNAFD